MMNEMTLAHKRSFQWDKILSWLCTLKIKLHITCIKNVVLNFRHAHLFLFIVFIQTSPLTVTPFGQDISVTVSWVSLYPILFSIRLSFFGSKKIVSVNGLSL